MSVKVTNGLPANVIEIGNEVSQAVVDGLTGASPSASSANPFLTVDGADFLPLTGGTLGDYNEVTNSVVITPNSIGVNWDYDNLRVYITPANINLYNDGDTASTTLTATSLNIDNGFNADKESVSIAEGSVLINYSGITFPDSTVQTTAAVAPTFATDAQVIAGTSASTVMSPARSQYGMIDWANAGVSIATNVSTGTVTSHNWGSRCQLTATASGQYAIAFPSNGSTNVFTTTGTSYADCNFSKRIKIYGRIYVKPTANQNYYYAWGRSNNTVSTIGSPAAKGFGIRIQGTGAVELQVHNGTTLYSTTSSFTPTTDTTFDCLIDSIGDGNVNLYINGSLVATDSRGATGTGAASFPLLIQEVSSTGTSAQGAIFVAGRSIYMA
ncbi:hypothetical protein CCP3SC1AL1_400009 [Gammaproteobacteria bacterium]